jgi:hypothetical protein
MKKPTSADRQEQALHALNCAIACMVAWPPGPEHLGGAVYFTALALHRLAQADPGGEAATYAEKFLAQALDRGGAVAVARQEEA